MQHLHSVNTISRKLHFSNTCPQTKLSQNCLTLPGNKRKQSGPTVACKGQMWISIHIRNVFNHHSEIYLNPQKKITGITMFMKWVRKRLLCACMCEKRQEKSIFLFTLMSPLHILWINDLSPLLFSKGRKITI